MNIALLSDLWKLTEPKQTDGDAFEAEVGAPSTE